jgi:hypothetical protein
MDPDFVDQAQEDADFEAGSEDMELRAARLEAEAEARMEGEYESAEAHAAYDDYLDTTVDRGADPTAVLSFEEFASRPFVANRSPYPEVLPSAPESEDDIPF